MFLKNKIAISCETAVYLIAKRQEEQLPVTERLQLFIHLIRCKSCNNTAKRAKQTASAIKKMNRTMARRSVRLELTEEQKKSIAQALRKEGK